MDPCELCSIFSNNNRVQLFAQSKIENIGTIYVYLHFDGTFPGGKEKCIYKDIKFMIFRPLIDLLDLYC